MTAITNYIINLVGDSANVQRAIREIGYFRHVSDNMLQLLVSYGKIVKIKKNETIIKQGDFDQWVYIILSGVLDVIVDDHKIDTVSVSLIGEKCILGETRKASLKAHTDEVILLAIDMAIIDELSKNTGEDAQQNKESCVEFLCAIASVVYQRLCQLWFYQLGKKKITHRLFELDMLQRAICALNFNKLRNNKNITDFLKFFLQEHLPDYRSTFIREDGTVDTQKICIYLQQNNLYRLFDELVEGVTGLIEPHTVAEFKDIIEDATTIEMDEVAGECFQIVADLIDDKDRLQEEWHSIFNRENEVTFSAYRLLKDIQNSHRDFSVDKQHQAVIGFLKIFTGYNDKVNKNTGKIYALQNQIKLKEIQPDKYITDPLTFSILGENLISSFQTIDEHLITPYISALNKIHPEPDNENLKDPAVTYPTAKQSSPLDNGGKKIDQEEIDKMFN